MRKSLPKFYDENNDLIQCQICKKWFKSLGGHLRFHRTNGENYKKEFELIDGDLIALSVRLDMSKSGKIALKRDPERKKMLLKLSKKWLKVAITKPKNITQRVKEIQSQNKISPKQRKKMITGIRKFWKSPNGKKAKKKQSERQKTGWYQKCEVCGKKYWVKPYLAKTSFYCSNYCKNKGGLMAKKISKKLKGKKKPKGFGKAVSKRLKGKIRPELRTGKIIKCLICKKEFYIKPYNFKKKKFCSNKCRGIGRHKKLC